MNLDAIVLKENERIDDLQFKGFLIDKAYQSTSLNKVTFDEIANAFIEINIGDYICEKDIIIIWNYSNIRYIFDFLPSFQDLLQGSPFP